MASRYSIMSESTEKLLRVIRGQDPTAQKPQRATKANQGRRGPSVTAAPRGNKPSWRKRKVRCLGVDLSDHELRLALTEGPGQTLSAVRQTPYPAGLPWTDENFPMFLRDEVAALCGQVNDLAVWTHVVSPRVEVFSLLVPKVPQWELGEMITWRVHKDHPFDDTEYILDFDVQGHIPDQGGTQGGTKGGAKMAVLACLVPRDDVKRLRGLFTAAGLRLTGVTVAPLAFDALFRSGCHTLPDGAFALLDIANSSSRIDLYTQGRIVLSRMIKTGVTSMAEALAIRCRESVFAGITTPEDKTRDFAMPVPDENDAQEVIYNLEELERPLPQAAPIPRDLDEPRSNTPRPDTDQMPATAHAADPAPVEIDLHSATSLLLHKLTDAPLPSDTPCADLSATQIFSFIQPACERLTRQVERTFDYTVRTLAQPRPEQLLLTGDISAYDGLAAYMSKELSTEVQALDPFGPGNRLHGFATASLSPLQCRRLTLATALAGCPEHSAVNLLQTYLQRQEEKARQRANLVIYAAAIVVLLVLSLLYGLEQVTAREKTRTLRRMDERLAAFQPRVDETVLLRLAADLGREQARIANLSSNLKPVALLGEISRLTPENIRILHLRLDSGSKNNTAHPGKPDKNQGRESTPAAVTLDVLVIGPLDGLNTALSEYLFTLRNSPLFEVPLIHGKTIEHHPGIGQAMRVTLHLNAPQG